VPRNGENWRERQDAIRAILDAEAVESQEQLVRRLKRRGFRVTQSSVSRDLAELGVAKVDGRYVALERLAQAAAPDRAGGASAPAPGADDRLAGIASFLREVAPAGPHLLVVKTPPGGASPVGIAIDAARWPEVVGTVAGDDTLFVATPGRAAQARVEARLAQLTRRSSARA
jgi:transcriptional regulator of arginine metabolism